MSARSFLVGLIGQGVGPSLSPGMHEREASRQGLRYVYKTIDLRHDQIGPEHLRRLLEFAVELGFDGLNVTHPVKQAMVPLVERLSDEVGLIGALNTVLIRDGATEGHNTDLTGFARAFAEGLPDVPRHRVVLLGAGGAGTAVAHALARSGVERLVIVDPDAARAERVAASVADGPAGPSVEVGAPDRLAQLLDDAAGVVNASPVGMAAHPGSPIPGDLLRPELWVADIVYRPLVTDLLAAARARGCRTLDGSGMAVHQAADAFELFTGQPADRAAMARDFDDMVAAETAASQPSRDPEERNH